MTNSRRSAWVCRSSGRTRETVDAAACRESTGGANEVGLFCIRLPSGLGSGADSTDSGLVAAAEDGRPLHPESLSGQFVREAKCAGLPQIRLHDPRHSVASILLAQGVHPKAVSEQLGHATIALTLDTYSHINPSLQQEAAGVIAAAILDPASMPPSAAPTGQIRAITSGN
jgi:hypothetical protein